MIDFNIPFAQLPVGAVKSHFFDSGSFSLWSRSQSYAKENNCSQWDFYDTEQFWNYIDNYAVFVRENRAGIDYYSNVDAIPNPKLTWRNQRYLEDSHNLEPIPVVHFPTDLKWLQRYIDRGYEYISLGGMVGSIRQDDCRFWIDSAFDLVCSTPNRMPKVKIHGFGVTSFDMLLRYPWYSVDSTSWTKMGAFGGIYVPHKRGGKFVYDTPPYTIKCSIDSPDKSKRGKHVLNISKMEIKIIKEWLEFIDIPLGKIDIDGEVLEWGVITRHTERRAANLLFYEQMLKHIQPWPWAFTSLKIKGFGI